MEDGLRHTSDEADDCVENQEHTKVGPGGFVRLVRYMGGDATILQAARVSYGNGTKNLRDDAGLLGYLMAHEHWSPFEQVIFQFHIRLPIFVARQMVRHRTARLNEISARYSVMNTGFWTPTRDGIRKQSTKNKQGSYGVAEIPDDLFERWINMHNQADALYKELLEHDVAREQARTVLPVSMYTEWYWQCDLRNLLHFLKLRMDSHAQLEMQEFANAMCRYVSMVVPYTMKECFAVGGMLEGLERPC